MQQAIDQIIATVTSRATAEVARQELQELAAQRETVHARRATELARERDAARNERDRRAAELEHERAGARNERDQLVAALEQRMRELVNAQQRAATLERERDSAATERDCATAERDAVRRERFALRLRMTALAEEQASLRNKFSITRQDDLLRHVLSATVDFEHFTVRKVVAVGGNGIVLLCDVTVPAWCVTDEADAAAAAAGARTTQVAVAVKVLAGVEHPRHTLLKHRFLREFQTLSDMPPHPNVVTLLAFLTKSLPRPMYDLLPDGFRELVGGAANPVLALIMPLLPHTLEAAAAAGAEPAQLVRWCLEVSAAVAHMWEYQWVHLDLKLNNVLVADDGRAVLTDMGTAMPVAADGSLTVPAQMGLEGNPAHRAPEVLASWRHAIRMREAAALVQIDAGRQEVWAVGVLLHELVAGKHPYGEQYPTEGFDGAAEVDEAELVARGLAADTVAVVRRMVSSDPGARPANPVAAHAELVASVPAAHRPAPADLAGPALVQGPQPGPPPYHDRDAPLELCSAEQPFGLQPGGVNDWKQHCAPGLAMRNGHVREGSARSRWLSGLVGLAVLALMLSMGLRWLSDVPLRDVEQAFRASQLNLPTDPATCNPVPNEWGRQLQAWSEHNDAARLCLAVLMRWGAGGMQQDEAQARTLTVRSMAWCRGAAANGEAMAQWLLGVCFDNGEDVTVAQEDHAQAAAWWRRAAHQGHADAQWLLGVYYMNGIGVAADHEQAAAWFRRAAEQGHADGQNNLGVCYNFGWGVAAKSAQAVAWFRQAAEQGNALAQGALGDCYQNGDGCRRDHAQAVAWFRRAAEQGNAEAKARLLQLGE